MGTREDTDAALAAEREESIAASSQLLSRVDDLSNMVADLQFQLDNQPQPPAPPTYTLGVSSRGRAGLEKALLGPVRGVRVFEDLNEAVSLLQDGYEVIFSFKDAFQATSVSLALGRFQNVWVSWHHEPEDNLTPTQFKAQWNALVGSFPGIKMVPILMGGVGGKSIDSLKSWLDGLTNIAAIGVDCYLRELPPWSRTLSGIATPALQYARSRGIPLLMPEFGVRRPTDPTLRAQALNDFHAFLSANPDVVSAYYWNQVTVKDGVSRDYVIDNDGPAMAAYTRMLVES